MPYDMTSYLWPNAHDVFFRDLRLNPQRQRGPHCVSTALAILTGGNPTEFQEVINTQDPSSWSDALQKWGMKLAYCPTDVRRLEFYVDELAAIDDLFVLSYYTTTDAEAIVADPNEDGWVCGSHIVVLHRSFIFDPLTGGRDDAMDAWCRQYYTKRVFRVVPKEYSRGL